MDSPASWEPPAEYLLDDVSATVANIVLGHRPLSTHATPDAAAEAGVNAVLVGEALMRSADPAVTIRRLIGSLRPVDSVTGGED